MQHRACAGAIWEDLPPGAHAVQGIHRAYLAMSKAVSGIGKLHGNIWICVDGIEAYAVAKNILNKLLSGGKRQEFMFDNPLVVPPDETPRLVIDIGSHNALLSKMVNNGIMKLEECQVKLRDNEMYVVARVSN